MNLKHNSPATKVTDTTNIFWVAAALCWQSAGCNYIGPTQTRPAFYWLQLHWGKYDILTEFRVCCSSVRMKQLQFLLSNNRGPEVFARKKTPTINCHQNDNYHDHHWDETLRTVPVASESIRFYISTYSARFTLLARPGLAWHDGHITASLICWFTQECRDQSSPQLQPSPPLCSPPWQHHCPLLSVTQPLWSWHNHLYTLPLQQAVPL